MERERGLSFPPGTNIRNRLSKSFSLSFAAVAAQGMLFACFTDLSTASAQVAAITQTNTIIRVVAANLTSGSNQRYEAPGLRILTGLKPDVVAIQEFNYASTNGLGVNTPAAMREMIDATFGTNFSYFRETNGYAIPNGIASRYPILASGSWTDSDTGVNDRGFAWAQIDLPGTNDLYVVSVHLKASSGSSNEARRAAEAAELTGLIQTNLPANAWLLVAGDMNLYSETEGAITTFKTYLSDQPVPEDLSGGTNTNAGRSERYDRVLISFSLTNALVPVAFPSRTLTNGLVFISTNYVPLSDVAPVQYGDSFVSGMQHMAVVKDFQVAYSVTNFLAVPPPFLTMRTQGIIEWEGLSNITYTVQAKTNLVDADWINVGSASSPSTNFTFSNESNGASEQFFRVVYP